MSQKGGEGWVAYLEGKVLFIQHDILRFNLQKKPKSLSVACLESLCTYVEMRGRASRSLEAHVPVGLVHM